MGKMNVKLRQDMRIQTNFVQIIKMKKNQTVELNSRLKEQIPGCASWTVGRAVQVFN